MLSLPFSDPRQTERLLTEFLQGTSEAVVCVDESGQVIGVNDRFLALVGWTGPTQGLRLDGLLGSWKARCDHPERVDEYFTACLSASPPEGPVELQPQTGQVIEGRFRSLEGLPGGRLRLWFLLEWRTSALAWVGHEIKNPLNAVLGFSELLAESLQAHPANDATQDALRGLQIGAKHLHGVLGDLLDLSRLESGVVVPRLEWVALPEFLKDLADLYRPRFVRRGLDFQVQGPEPASVDLLIDPRRLAQVLANLLSNALRFTKRGWVALRVVHDDPTWSFHVEDSGVGIPLNQQKTIFQPFVQAQGQNTRKLGGSGLGLAISRALVESLGGRLTLESEPGAGCRFSVVFDTLEVRSSPASGLGLAGMAGGPLVVLVADDEASNHLLVKGFLRGTPVSVVSAHNGLQAVELWKAHRPRVVLLDLRMPGVTGIEAARRIRAFDHGGKTKILAMSATRPSSAEASEGRRLWSDFLEKPFRKEDFLKFLSKHLTFVDESVTSP